MGLFDTLRCEHPLTEGCLRQSDAQHIDPLMNHLRAAPGAPAAP